MIDRATIDKIMSAADIVEVVSEFVTLRKAGVNYKGLCPFHNEKTPSFVVSPAKNFCHCFSCGKGGNSVGFIMEHEQLTYPEALRWLAKKYHIEIVEKELTADDIKANNERASMLILNQWANDYFQHILYDTEEGQSIGMAYLRQRGFRDDIIKKFQLGYCLDRFEAMSGEALAKGYQPEYLVKTGLCAEHDGSRLRDKYRGRVIFPVHALDGKVVAFGGRILSNEKKAAKYINSPESAIYHKSNELYGIYLAKRAIQKADRCFLVEGYTDVISMHQSGIENVVASSGTSLTYGQIRMVHRFTENLTILYDGDMAGIKASLRGINMLLEEGMNIKVLLLPDGDDPDSFARKHEAKEYIEYIDSHQVDFIRFKVNILLQDCQNDPLKKASVVGSIVESICVIPNALVRSIYIKECSALLDMPEQILIDETRKRRAEFVKGRMKEQESQRLRTEQAVSVPANESSEPVEPAPTPVSPSSSESTPITPAPNPQPAAPKRSSARHKREEELIRAIIRYGELCMGYDEDEEGEETPVSVLEYIHADMEKDDLQFEEPLFQQILSEALAHLHEPDFKVSDYFLLHPDVRLHKLASEMLSNRYHLSENFAKERRITSDAGQLNHTVPLLLIDWKLSIVNEQIKEVMSLLQSPTLLADKEAYRAQMERYKQLKSLQSLLTAKGGISAIYG